ncbi:MAG: hypothetical protein AB8C46_22750 [Burkholderiaceae bacterium]
MLNSNSNTSMGVASFVVIASSSLVLFAVSLVSIHTLIAPVACLLERMLLA